MPTKTKNKYKKKKKTKTKKPVQRSVYLEDSSDDDEIITTPITPSESTSVSTLISPPELKYPTSSNIQPLQIISVISSNYILIASQEVIATQMRPRSKLSQIKILNEYESKLTKFKYYMTVELDRATYAFDGSTGFTRIIDNYGRSLSDIFTHETFLESHLVGGNFKNIDIVDKLDENKYITSAQIYFSKDIIRNLREIVNPTAIFSDEKKEIM